MRRRDQRESKGLSEVRGSAFEGSVLFKVGVGLVLLATCTTITSRAVRGPLAASSTEPLVDWNAPPKEVSATALWNAYEANEATADAAYKNRFLLVTGRVLSIDKDFSADAIVHLEGGGNQFMGVRAYLNDDDQSSAIGLSKGQELSVNCVGSGKTVGSPVLKQCRVE